MKCEAKQKFKCEELLLQICNANVNRAPDGDMHLSAENMLLINARRYLLNFSEKLSP